MQEAAIGTVLKGPNVVMTVERITVTIYFIHPSRKLKLSFDRTAKNISQIMNHTHTSYTYAPFLSNCIH